MAADLFESSTRKLMRAKEHILDLELKIFNYVELSPYACVVDPDPHVPEHQVHKLRLTQPLPDELPTIIGDAANNLREALDNAGYAVAIASGQMNPQVLRIPLCQKCR